MAQENFLKETLYHIMVNDKGIKCMEIKLGDDFIRLHENYSESAFIRFMCAISFDFNPETGKWSMGDDLRGTLWFTDGSFSMFYGKQWDHTKIPDIPLNQCSVNDYE